jgi:3-oxo-5-alpha-steroid 4-dehydrogenase 1
MMCLHYFNRSFIYPMNIRSKNPVPISITFFAFVFCTYNGFLQGIELTQNAQFGIEKLSSPSFIIGLVTFFCGFFGNLHSDSILRNLRKPGETGYKIPMGGLFQYVSAANYFAESIEWVGFAIACWNLASGLCLL